MDTRYKTLLEDINNLAGRSNFDLNYIITSLNKYHDEEMTISKNASEGYGTDRLLLRKCGAWRHLTLFAL